MGGRVRRRWPKTGSPGVSSRCILQREIPCTIYGCDGSAAYGILICTNSLGRAKVYRSLPPPHTLSSSGNDDRVN
jgi:hypothetical protein